MLFISDKELATSSPIRLMKPLAMSSSDCGCSFVNFDRHCKGRVAGILVPWRSDFRKVQNEGVVRMLGSIKLGERVTSRLRFQRSRLIRREGRDPLISCKTYLAS